MTIRSLLFSVVCTAAMAIPGVALADATAVAKLSYSLPNGDWHEVYFKSAEVSQAAADAAALQACRMARVKSRAGSVVRDSGRCDMSSLADYQIAQSVAEGSLRTATNRDDALKSTASFKGP